MSYAIRRVLAVTALGALFLSRESYSAPEMWLLVAVFVPGVLSGWASLIAFGRPMMRFLRAPDA